MNCKVAENNSIEYLDGRAEPGARHEMEAHLAGCGACREHIRQLRELWGVLEETPVLSPSASFDAAVRARVAGEPRRSIWAWLGAPSPRLAVAVTALVMFCIWLSSMPLTEQLSGSRAVEAEFRMIVNLPVLEDYDVLSNFEVLSDLPVQPLAEQQPGI
jgi:anti-sigma factor RsiW